MQSIIPSKLVDGGEAPRPAVTEPRGDLRRSEMICGDLRSPSAPKTGWVVWVERMLLGELRLHPGPRMSTQWGWLEGAWPPQRLGQGPLGTRGS